MVSSFGLGRPLFQNSIIPSFRKTFALGYTLSCTEIPNHLAERGGSRPERGLLDRTRLGAQRRPDPVHPERRRGLIQSIQSRSSPVQLHRVHPIRITDDEYAKMAWNIAIDSSYMSKHGRYQLDTATSVLRTLLEIRRFAPRPSTDARC